MCKKQVPVSWEEYKTLRMKQDDPLTIIGKKYVWALKFCVF